MDTLETLYTINKHLNDNSGIYNQFSMVRNDGFNFSISYFYKYRDIKKETETIVEIKDIFKIQDRKIIPNYHNLEKARFIAEEVGYKTLFDIEKRIAEFNEIPNDKKTETLYILKANYSHSVLMRERHEFSTVYDLHNIYGDIPNNFDFLFTLDEVKEIESNPNIIFDCYIVNVNDVLEKYNEKTYNEDKMFRFSKSLVINQNLFEQEESVDYYNTVLRIKRTVNKSIDDFKNKVDWIDNLLIVNSKFILEFYETQISFDLLNIKDVNVQEDLYDIIKHYNDCPHKVFNKYVVVDKKNKWFLQSKKTPIGEINIYPLKPKHIREFDEYCIFYLEEINEKFSTEMLADLFSSNSKYEIIPWDSIDEHRKELFKDISDAQYNSIVNNINNISKRVV